MSEQVQDLTVISRALRERAKEVPSDQGALYLAQAEQFDTLIGLALAHGDTVLRDRLTAAVLDVEESLDQQMRAMRGDVAGLTHIGKDTHQLVQGIHLDQQQFIKDSSERFTALEHSFREIGEAVDELRLGQKEIRAAHTELNNRHGRQFNELRQSIDELRHGGTELSQQHAAAIEQLAAQVQALAADLAQRPGLDETRRLVALIERHERQLGGSGGG